MRILSHSIHLVIVTVKTRGCCWPPIFWGETDGIRDVHAAPRILDMIIIIITKKVNMHQSLHSLHMLFYF